MRMPVLRFKADDGADFPDWKEKTLSEIAKRVTRKNKNNQTDIPLTISSLDGLVDQRDYFKKTVASKDMSGYFLLQNGEFAYNKSYSAGFDYGSIKRLDKYPCGALSTLYICFGLKPNVGIDSDYLTHYFDSQKWNPEVAAICAEGARNHGLLNVPTAAFFDIRIDVPSLPEQRKIADLLSTVDDVIVVQQAEVDAWEQRKKGVMQKLFSQEVRFKADDGSEFPDWEERTSVELCSRMIGGGTPSTSNTDNYNGDISWISSSDLDVDNITTVRRTRFITEGAIANSATKKVKPGSIAVVLRVGVGKVALLDRETCTSQDFISLEDVTGDTKFIAYMLSARMQREAVRTQGTSIKGIPATRFKELTYRMPSSIIEQRKIADMLSTVDNVIVKAKAELAKWQELKKGLLQQMFV